MISQIISEDIDSQQTESKTVTKKQSPLESPAMIGRGHLRRHTRVQLAKKRIKRPLSISKIEAEETIEVNENGYSIDDFSRVNSQEDKERVLILKYKQAVSRGKNRD
jgi:hypothetical protein